MNTTIAKIIGLLFEDLEDTDEVRAIHEEVLTNCQDRYEDMIALGLSQDEAIHSVIESLSGMEEMLRPYPRKKAGAAPQTPEASDMPEIPEAPEAPHETHFTFDPAQTPVREIRATRLGSMDVQLSTSLDGLVHIECEDNTVAIRAGIQNDALVVEPAENARARTAFNPLDTSAMNGMAGAAAAGKEGLFGMLDNLFNNLFHNFSISLGGGSLRISIPENLRPAVKIDTTSGDVDADGIRLRELHIGTASGDIDLVAVNAQSVRLSSASGDVEIEDLCADTFSGASTSGDVSISHAAVTEQARLNTTSGDIEWNGDCAALEVNTISGDAKVEGSFAEIRYKTVSGDANVTLCGERLQNVSGKSSSGDQRLWLPAQAHASVICRSVSGDVHQRVPNDPDGPVRVELSSASGDITIS